MIQIMKRDLYTALLKWKTSKTRKPLILRGARQVGKTHLLKAFGETEYSNMVYLNFEKDAGLAGFFAGSLEPKDILVALRNYKRQKIEARNTLLIFDEVQECATALNSLKYFFEEAPEFHIVAAGSLLGVKLSSDKGFPVGKVNFLELFPMSFFEFLDAAERPLYRQMLEEISSPNPVPEPIHHELIELIRTYLFVGGMPEAVARYINNKELQSVREIHHEILKAYSLDFAKHAPKTLIAKITAVWESIPSQLARENKKFMFSAIRQSARGRDYEDAIVWLADAGLILRCFHLSAPRLPLSGYKNSDAFKVFSLDVGLLSTMSHVPISIALQTNELFTEFKGALTENLAAQLLMTRHLPLYYWTSNGSAEVDFIIEHEGQVFPLEVKSGMTSKHKSLQVYQQKYNPSKVVRASLNNLRKDGELLNIPLYFIERILAI